MFLKRCVFVSNVKGREFEYPKWGMFGVPFSQNSFFQKWYCVDAHTQICSIYFQVLWNKKERVSKTVNFSKEQLSISSPTPHKYINGSRAVYRVSPNCSSPQISKWDSLKKLCFYVWWFNRTLSIYLCFIPTASNSATIFWNFSSSSSKKDQWSPKDFPDSLILLQFWFWNFFLKLNKTVLNRFTDNLSIFTNFCLALIRWSHEKIAFQFCNWNTKSQDYFFFDLN